LLVDEHVTKSLGFFSAFPPFDVNLTEKREQIVVLPTKRLENVRPVDHRKVIIAWHKELLRYCVAMIKRKATHFRNLFSLGGRRTRGCYGIGRFRNVAQVTLFLVYL
jgi:hypothetical protein